MSEWQNIVSEQLRKAGPTMEDKAAAMKRASRIYHGEEEHHEEHADNPMGEESFGENVLAIGLGVGLGLLGIAFVGGLVRGALGRGCATCGGPYPGGNF